MANRMHPDRISEIRDESVSFPIFFFQQGINDIRHAMYVTQLVGQDVNGVPESIVVNKESGDGVTTVAVYTLAASSKAMPTPENYDPIDN